MSTVVGFPHEFRSNGARRKRKPRVRDNGAQLPLPPSSGNGTVVPPVALDFSGDGNWLQAVLEFLAAIWAKILELEAKLLAAVERMAGVNSPAGVSLPPKKHVTTHEFAEISGLKPETIEKYCREGKLLAFKANGRGKFGENRIPLEEVEHWRKHGLRRPSPIRPDERKFPAE